MSAGHSNTSSFERGKLACSLAMPAGIAKRLKAYRRRRPQPLRKILHRLLDRHQYRILNGAYLRPIRATTRYQSRGQNLHRIDFRVRPEDWMELKQLARVCNVSACLLFTMLCSVELYGADADDAIEGRRRWRLREDIEMDSVGAMYRKIRMLRFDKLNLYRRLLAGWRKNDSS